MKNLLAILSVAVFLCMGYFIVKDAIGFLRVLWCSFAVLLLCGGFKMFYNEIFKE